jgi:hypothetical protein
MKGRFATADGGELIWKERLRDCLIGAIEPFLRLR